MKLESVVVVWVANQQCWAAEVCACTGVVSGGQRAALWGLV